MTDLDLAARMPARPTRRARVVPSGARPAHVPALDGLRGLAIAGVLLFHTDHLGGGFLGVDLFFVLSGFLITGLLLREATTGKVSLVSFWGRRVRRLFPALAVLLAAVALGVWGLQRAQVPGAGPDLVRTTLADGLWSQLDLVNWHLLAQDASYWDALGQARVFEHLWSIAVEEQTYVAWPLLVAAIVVVARRRAPDTTTVHAAVLVVAAGLAAASLAAMIVVHDPADPTRAYTGTDTRAFSLLLGAAAATSPARRALRRLTRAHRGATATAITALAAGVLGSWLVADGPTTPGLFTGGLFAHALACTALVGICAEASAEPPASTPVAVRLLASRPLRWLGGVSYSLYLWHWPVVVLLPLLVGTALPAWASTPLVVGTSLALAVASKRLVEDPVRFRARWARGRRGAVVLAVASAALLALWFGLPGPQAPHVETF